MIKKVQAIIYDVDDGVYYFLIFHRILHWKGWEFLKETMEPGETQLQCLRRGIREETHLKNYRIEKRLNRAFAWHDHGQPTRIVQVYAVRVPKRQRVSLRQKIMEHDKYTWATKKQALKLLTYTNARSVLNDFFRNIKNKP